MEKINLDKVQLAWCQDILQHISKILTDSSYSQEQKLESIAWLVEQARKTERED